ncbi:MAG: pyridoxamine 5'-phosphate oxidase family protein [Candidatus Hodarchaeota archaeon]
MDRQEIEEFLKEAPIGRLGTVYEQQPYIVPINFLYHEGKIYFHGKNGKKITNLKSNNKVCFEIDEFKEILSADTACQFTVRARSVITIGKVKFIEEPMEKQRILEKFMAKYSPGGPKSFNESQIRSVIIGEIQIETMEGKKKYWD